MPWLEGGISYGKKSCIHRRDAFWWEHLRFRKPNLIDLLGRYSREFLFSCLPYFPCGLSSSGIPL